jgi:hypothetical protein
MSKPVLNTKKVFENIFFFNDLHDAGKWYHGPHDKGWKFNTPATVAGRTIINATKELVPSAATIRAFSAATNSARTIVPLPLRKKNIVLVPDIIITPEHSVKLSVLEDVPFPSFLFSATLSKSVSNHDQLLQEILEKLQFNSLTKEKLELSCVGITVVDKISVTINPRELLQSFIRTAGISQLTQHQFMERMINFIKEKENDIIHSMTETSGAADLAAIKDHVFSKLQGYFLARKEERRLFDGEINFSVCKLRDPLEIDNTNLQTTLLKTKEDTISISI